MSENAMLDTGFLIRLLKKDDELHETARGYFEYFVSHDIRLYVSTIAIAEFCVKDDLSSLPMRNLIPVPFNITHACRAGELVAMVNKIKTMRGAKIYPRAIVPNDTKMFAQADIEQSITYFLSADSEANKVFNMLNEERKLSFRFVDIRQTTCNRLFGTLDL